MEPGPSSAHAKLDEDEIVEDTDFEEEVDLDVDAAVEAADLLSLWKVSCSPVSFTSNEPNTNEGGMKPNSRHKIHVVVDDDPLNRDGVLVTYGSGDIATDTTIFSLEGKLSYVALAAPDVVSSRSHNRPTRNDQYNVSVDVSRSSSDVIERRLNHIYSKGCSGPQGLVLAQKAGLQALTCEDFNHTWRSDLRLYLRNFVARPQNDFSKKRNFSVPESSCDFIKPKNFVYGPAPIFFDEEGHYIMPSDVKAEALHKNVRVMFTVKLSASPQGKIYCNFEVLSVQIIGSENAASPGKKRKLELGI